KVEQVVKLVRSKGVGVYFVTQNPVDIPDEVLAQLGNRVQHALRAYTPKEAKAVRVAAETFRPNPAFDTEEVIKQLGVGEALVSTLEKKGVPSIVGQTMMRPPSSRLGPITKSERQKIINASPVANLYEKRIDRISAFETLEKRVEKRRLEEERQREREDFEREEYGRMRRPRTGYNDDYRDDRPTKSSRKRKGSRRRSSRQSTTETAMKTLVRTVARNLGNRLVRGILGSLKRGL
ncbi:MAG: DUF853 domain-containing protein, partial [Devosiaceae bacterium]|nr:DUF853 domain-containing protein [Devosiaceae bacterium]